MEQCVGGFGGSSTITFSSLSISSSSFASAEWLNSASISSSVRGSASKVAASSSHSTTMPASKFKANLQIKIRHNSLSGSVNFFKGVNVIDIRSTWFRNFGRFKLSRVSLSHGSQNWLSYREFREIEGLRNRG